MKLNLLARSKFIILKIVGGIVIALSFFVLGMNYLPTQELTLNEQTGAIIQPRVEQQHKIESEIAAYYRSGKFTFDKPLVIQNPYRTAPLTALLIFDTQENIQISVHIPGKTPQSSVDFTFESFSKHHEIPVYGLYADTINHITLTGQNKAGETSETVIDLKTEPLPIYLDMFKIVTANPDLYNPGMNFTLEKYKIVFDINGEIRWFTTDPTFQTFAFLENGHCLFTFFVDKVPNIVVMEMDLLGKIYAIYNVPYGVHHDFAELPNGNILVTSGDNSPTAKEDFIYEIDRKNGYFVRTFDLKKYLDYNREHEIGVGTYDWLHMNSLVYDAKDGSILFSARSQSAVIKMSYPEMKIQWILGPHDNWSAKYQPYLLTPVGNNFEWQWSQHHATILSQATLNGSQLIDILLFDNGLYRSFNKEDALSAADSYSRVVHYQINETRRTVEQIWEYGKERGSDIFSISRGSAYLLEKGNIFGTWSEIARDTNGSPITRVVEGSGTVSARMIEVNPLNNQVTFEVVLNNSVNYRTIRANLYDRYKGENSILSAKLNDTSTFDLGKRVITALQPVKKQLDVAQLWVKAAAKKALRWLKII
jgi:arylsulfate sulfotransferase